MPEEFEVKGPHEEHLEKVGEHGHGEGDNFSSRIAIMTAILATVGALFSFQVGSTQNEALADKNNASIAKTQAADQWNYYQAKSSKQDVAELATVLPGADHDKYQSEVARYKTEKEAIKKHAEEIEASSAKWDDASEETLHRHHRWAQAMTALQVAIALAAITLLTRKKIALFATFAVAAVGIVLGYQAFMMV